MNPYRKAAEVPEEDKHTRELAMFGVRMDTGRPILERVKTNRCTKCNGFGTYGNPLCGAVYTCDRCKGSGYDPEGKGTDEKCESKSEPPQTSPSLPKRMSVLDKIRSIFGFGKGT